MKPKHRKHQTPHSALVTHLRFADVIDEVSQLAADPIEAALVIEHMLRRREISFTDDFDSFEFVL